MRDCIQTVTKAIAEGVILVILVVYLFLRSLSGALVIALSLPWRPWPPSSPCGR